MNNFLNIGGKDLLKKTLIMASFPQAIPVVLLNELAEQYDSPHRRKKNISDLSKDNVEPGVGSLIYCELFKMEHSGIYMGDHRIAQLNGKGKIEIVTPDIFTANSTTLDCDIFIPVNADGQPITYYHASENAKRVIGQTRKYNLILNNCHQFCSGCITGDYENNNKLLLLTKKAFSRAVQQKVLWQRWDWQKK